MLIGDRIKELRRELGLNQTEFGERINVKQTSIGMYENGHRAVTDRSMLQICQAFNVNESWLRTGQGDMFVENDSTVLSLLQKEYNLPQDQLAIIESFLSISEEQRSAISEFVADLCTRLNPAPAPTENPQQEEDWKQRELADYAAELDAEQRAQLVCEDSDGKNGTK